MAEPESVSRDELLHRLVHDKHVEPESARDMVAQADRKGSYREPFRFIITREFSTAPPTYTLADIKTGGTSGINRF